MRANIQCSLLRAFCCDVPRPRPSHGSYAATVLGRHVLNDVVAAPVVQEGERLLEGRRPAARPAAHLVPAAVLEGRLDHVPHGEVVVLPVGRAPAAAVLQNHLLVALVAQAQLAHLQDQLPQVAGPGLPGSLSPGGLAVVEGGLAPPSLPVQQISNHVLELALREALEHHGNWKRTQTPAVRIPVRCVSAERVQTDGAAVVCVARSPDES